MLEQDVSDRPSNDVPADGQSVRDIVRDELHAALDIDESEDHLDDTHDSLHSLLQRQYRQQRREEMRGAAMTPFGGKGRYGGKGGKGAKGGKGSALRSRCARCGEYGHWSASCEKPISYEPSVIRLRDQLARVRQRRRRVTPGGGRGYMPRMSFPRGAATRRFTRGGQRLSALQGEEQYATLPPPHADPSSDESLDWIDGPYAESYMAGYDNAAREDELLMMEEDVVMLDEEGQAFHLA